MPPLTSLETEPVFETLVSNNTSAVPTPDNRPQLPPSYTQASSTPVQNDETDSLFPRIRNGPASVSVTNAVIESPPDDMFAKIKKPDNTTDNKRQMSADTLSPDKVSDTSDYDNHRKDDLKNHNITPVDSLFGQDEPTRVLSYATSSTCSSSTTSGPDSPSDSEEEEEEDSGTEKALFEKLLANPRVISRAGSISSESDPKNRPPMYRSKPGSITSLTSLNGSPWEGFSLPPSLNNDDPFYGDQRYNHQTLPASYKTAADVIGTDKYLLYNPKDRVECDQLKKEGESLIEKLQRLNDDPESTIL